MKWIGIVQSAPPTTAIAANDARPLSDFDRFVLRAWRYLPLAVLVALVLGFVAGLKLHGLA